MNKRRLRPTTQIAALAAMLTVLAACATNPVADEKIAVAKAALQRAEQSGAPEFAPLEIATARDKLARAQQANAAGELVPATQLAEQANADAQLAEATAQQQRSHKAAMEFDASMVTLRQESMHTSPPAQ
jgi:glutathione synthase/RimK-type ligase-like ATP-grasp enzyme